MEKNKKYILIDCANMGGDLQEEIKYIIINKYSSSFVLLQEADEVEDVAWIEIKDKNHILWNYILCHILGTIVEYYAYDCKRYPSKSTRIVDINDIIYMNYEHSINFGDLENFIDEEMKDEDNLKTWEQIKEELL